MEGGFFQCSFVKAVSVDVHAAEIAPGQWSLARQFVGVSSLGGLAWTGGVFFIWIRTRSVLANYKGSSELGAGRVIILKSENQIRTSWKARMSGKLGGWLIRLLGMTLRREVNGNVSEYNSHSKPLIFVLWHNQILTSPYLWRKMFPTRECVVLTSASKDGAVLASAVKVFKVGAVHGSSSRRGAAAIVALRRAARNGKDLVFTPDGPRGPRYHLQPGVVKIAQTTGLLVLPLRIEYLSCWTLKSWDRFRIPKPFSKVRITLEELIAVPRELTDGEFEKERLRLENCLLKGITDREENHGNDH